MTVPGLFAGLFEEPRTAALEVLLAATGVEAVPGWPPLTENEARRLLAVASSPEAAILALADVVAELSRRTPHVVAPQLLRMRGGSTSGPAA